LTLLSPAGFHRKTPCTCPRGHAGGGRLLLLTGGDDQALCLTLLQLTLGSSPTSTGISNGSAGEGANSCTSCSCATLLQLSIPNAHSSAARAVWLEAPGGVAAASSEGEAVHAATTGLEPNLELAAFSVGLDQQVRCWRVRLVPQQPAQLMVQQPQGQQQEEQCMPGCSNYCTSNSSSGGSQICLSAEEVRCEFTQVVEPAALDVLPLPASAECDAGAPAPEPIAATGAAGVVAPAASSSGINSCSIGSVGSRGGRHRRFLVGVAGRGTEVLSWSVPPAG